MIATPWTPTPIKAPVLEQTIFPRHWHNWHNFKGETRGTNGNHWSDKLFTCQSFSTSPTCFKEVPIIRLTCSLIPRHETCCLHMPLPSFLAMNAQLACSSRCARLFLRINQSLTVYIGAGWQNLPVQGDVRRLPVVPHKAVAEVSKIGNL